MNYRCGCTIGRSPGQAPKVCNSPLHGVPTNRRKAARQAAAPTAADQKFEEWKRAALEEMTGDIRHRAAARTSQPAPRPATAAPVARPVPSAPPPAVAASAPSWQPVTADERERRDAAARQVADELGLRLGESLAAIGVLR